MPKNTGIIQAISEKDKDGNDLRTKKGQPYVRVKIKSVDKEYAFNVFQSYILEGVRIGDTIDFEYTITESGDTKYFNLQEVTKSSKQMSASDDAKILNAPYYGMLSNQAWNMIKTGDYADWSQAFEKTFEYNEKKRRELNERGFRIQS